MKLQINRKTNWQGDTWQDTLDGVEMLKNQAKKDYTQPIIIPLDSLLAYKKALTKQTKKKLKFWGRKADNIIE